MNTMIFIGIFFGVLSAIFAGLAIRGYVREGSKLDPKRKTWALISLIFIAVSIGLVSLSKLVL